MASTAGRLPRRTLALTSVLVTAAVAASLATARPDAPSAPGAGETASAAISPTWAHTASGKIVPVSPTHYATPIHPEALTHPDADDMGSSIASMQLTSSTQNTSVPAGPGGIDVSSNQKPISWAKVAPHVDFVYAKATEGTYYTNPEFNNEYEGPYSYGLIRGAYHFAIPNNSSGTAQADYFVAHGGGWSSDGKTLPGALDIEYNPYSGGTCYGLSQSSMVSWIAAFINEYHAKTTRWATIYTTTDWWTTCTGNYSGFWANNPLWIAKYASSPGTLPSGAPYYTFWQYADSGTFPGDQDYFNGALDRLQALANG